MYFYTTTVGFGYRLEVGFHLNMVSLKFLSWVIDPSEELVLRGPELSLETGPNIIIYSSQHAITHRKVAFMPPVEDIGPEPLFVQFVFSVRDLQGGAISGLVFNITITPVDNVAPEVRTPKDRSCNQTRLVCLGPHW